VCVCVCVCVCVAASSRPALRKFATSASRAAGVGPSKAHSVPVPRTELTSCHHSQLMLDRRCKCCTQSTNISTAVRACLAYLGVFALQVEEARAQLFARVNHELVEAISLDHIEHHLRHAASAAEHTYRTCQNNKVTKASIHCSTSCAGHTAPVLPRAEAGGWGRPSTC
jgi:hypothetical protein